MQTKFLEFCQTDKLVVSFLKVDKHKLIFDRYIKNPNHVNKQLLDERFKIFYFNIRFVSLISKTLHFTAINFDKKINNDKNKMETLLQNKDLISETLNLTYFNKDLEQSISDEKVFEYIKKLSPRQKKILTLSYVETLNDTEIGEVLQSSQQNISKMKKNILEKLKKHLIDARNGDSL